MVRLRRRWTHSWTQFVHGSKNNGATIGGGGRPPRAGQGEDAELFVSSCECTESVKSSVVRLGITADRSRVSCRHAGCFFQSSEDSMSDKVVSRVLHELNTDYLADAALRSTTCDGHPGDAHPPDIPWMVVLVVYAPCSEAKGNKPPRSRVVSLTVGICFRGDDGLNYPQ